MNRWTILFWGLCVGCASSPNRHQPAATADHGSITVHVDGSVNRPGVLQLDFPFTVEHAIGKAGGLSKWEQDSNRQVSVVSADGKKSRVRRKEYGSFKLSDGDEVFIPRH